MKILLNKTKHGTIYNVHEDLSHSTRNYLQQSAQSVNM